MHAAALALLAAQASQLVVHVVPWRDVHAGLPAMFDGHSDRGLHALASAPSVSTLGCFLMASSSARRAAVVSLVSARGNHIDRYLGPREGRIGPLSRFHFSLAAAFVSCLRRPRGRAGRGRRVALGLGADAVGSLRGKALIIVLLGSAQVDVFVQRVEPMRNRQRWVWLIERHAVTNAKLAASNGSIRSIPE